MFDRIPGVYVLQYSIFIKKNTLVPTGIVLEHFCFLYIQSQWLDQLMLLTTGVICEHTAKVLEAAESWTSCREKITKT